MSKPDDSRDDQTSGPVTWVGRKAYPRNPIGVIALFIFLIEAIAVASLKFLLDAGSPYTFYIVLFIIGFPLLLILLFFGTLWMRRESLYSPSDFREDANFIQLLKKVDARVERVEIRQKAAQLDPRGDPSDIFAVITDLLAKGDVETAISLGRAFLKVRRYTSSLKVFELLSRLPLSRNMQLQVIAFTAYSLNGLGLYRKALAELNELRRLDPAFGDKFWPALASSFAHFKLGNQTESIAWLEKAAGQSGASEYLELAVQLYPDLRSQLLERLSLEKRR